MKKVIGIIPSRYLSKRFEGKPLADVMGKPMIVRVYAQASLAKHLDSVVVATDDKRIEAVLKAHDIPYVMTSPQAENGTARCAEAYAKLGRQEDDFVLNIQGDEPFLAPEQIDDLLSEVRSASQTQDIGIATLAKQIEEVAWLENENVVKVVMNHHREAMYFSRAKVPHARLLSPQAALKRFSYYKHIGLYLYHINILKQLVLLPPTFLEEVEALEQLRWMSHGYKIRVALTNHQSINIDTPEDLQRAIETFGHRYTRH